MKPCVCNTPGCPTGKCHFCKLYETDERYRHLWSGEPSLIDKAATFTRAAIRHISAGLPKVSAEVQQQRLELCQVCPEYVADKGTCRKCGCTMKRKATWKLETCPLGKW